MKLLILKRVIRGLIGLTATHFIRSVLRRLSKVRQRIVLCIRGYIITNIFIPNAFHQHLSLKAEPFKDSRKKFLVLRFKYRSGNPDLGESQGEENLSDSIRSTDVAELFEYYYDLNGGLCLARERNLVSMVAKSRPHVIILSSYNVFGLGFPHFEVIRAIRRNCKIPIVVVWWDSTGIKTGNQLIEMGDDVDLNILIESSNLERGRADTKRFLRLWAPISHRTFYPASYSRDIAVSFIGSTGSYRSVRKEYLNYLLGNGIPLLIAGYDSGHSLSEAEFTDTLGRSLISLNFSHSVEGTHQMKGRVLEVLFSGGLLFESRNAETPEFFQPGIHYVEFDSKEDLLAKLRYYLNNKEEAEVIAERGRAWALYNYTQDHFWRRIMCRLSELGCVEN